MNRLTGACRQQLHSESRFTCCPGSVLVVGHRFEGGVLVLGVFGQLSWVGPKLG
jgi:hypothetical protein